MQTEEEALIDLYTNIARWLNDEKHTVGSRFKSSRSCFYAWKVGGPNIQWRERIVQQIMERASSIDPAAFRNLNQVRPKSLWPELYHCRLVATRAAMFVMAEYWPNIRRELSDILKARTQMVSWEAIPPGTYDVTVTDVSRLPGATMKATLKMADGRTIVMPIGPDLAGYRADVCIIDDVSDDNVVGDWESCTEDFDMMFAGAMTGRYSSISGFLNPSGFNEHDKEIITMFKNVKTLHCQFQGDSGTSRYYDYLSDDESVQVDDLVVVEANGSTNIVKVKNITVGITNKATKWIIQKIDFAGYKARLEKIAEAQEIKRQLDEAVERKRKLIDYEKIAEGDEDMQALLAKLKALQS